MPFTFSTPADHQDGAFLLGTFQGRPASIKTERHLFCVAGARSGKSAALAVPNLRAWSAGSVCVIDVKGELAAASWEAREAMGHKVCVLDPFGRANVPDRLRASFNPLEAIYQRDAARVADGKASTAREDIRVIAEGLVMRHAAENPVWDNGAVTVLAGMIAHNLATAPPEHRNLAAVRTVMRMPDNILESVWQDMAENPAYGSLAQAAAAVGLSSAKSAMEFVKGARDHTEWLDSEPMRSALSSSSFDLADLTRGKTALYLVLPPEYLVEHGRFLRLFVLAALNAMAQGGEKNEKCLFLLDEAAALGFLPSVYSAAGLMPSYGVTLWLFFQDLGQCVKLYGQEGAETFLGNADAHIFFGNTDPFTLDHISRRVGLLTMEEIGAAPIHLRGGQSSGGQGVADFMTMGLSGSGAKVTHTMIKGGAGLIGAAIEAAGEYAAQKEMNEWNLRASAVGKARLSPDEARELVAKRDGDKVARSMIVFAKGRDVFNLTLAPYFAAPVPSPALPEPQQARAAPLSKRQKEAAFFAAVLVYLALIAALWAVGEWWGFLIAAAGGFALAAFGKRLDQV